MTSKYNILKLQLLIYWANHNSDMLNDLFDQTLINYSFKSAEITA